MNIPMAVFLLLNCLDAMLVGQMSRIPVPHPIGTSVAITIIFGDAYATAIETYDARITVMAVIRGESAWDLLKKWNSLTEPPNIGFEYVLARIRFEFAARGKPGDKIYDLNQSQFVAFSSNGSTQYAAAKAVPPEPPLGGALHAGDSAEGWTIFSVARKDAKPFATFQPNVGVLSHTGTGPSFRLY